MKLRNKKTGEIGYLIVGRGSDHYVVADNEWYSCGKYDSLAELNEEWEDAPEDEDSLSWQVETEKTPSEVIGNIHDDPELLEGDQ